MKKVSAIFGISIGGLIAAFCLLALTTTAFTGSTTVWIRYGWNWWEETHMTIPGALDPTAEALLFLGLILAICLTVFSALMLRPGRQKGFAITSLVFSSILVSIVCIVLFAVYLGTSGKQKKQIS